MTPQNRARDSPWAVETRGLTKRFGDTVAVNGVDLRIPRGCAFGYLGPNGAGKTTLIRVLLGLTHADAGEMSLLGHAVPRHRDVALARVGRDRRRATLPRPPDRPAEPAGARGGAGTGRAARIEPSLERVGILHRADDRVSKYSMGMRQRLGVAACLIGDPQLLILDEPMNGLDPAGMHEMRDMILSLVAEGRTVVLSSHLLDEVERTCDAVAIVDRGQVIRQGPIAELLAGHGADPAGRMLRSAARCGAARGDQPRRHDRGGGRTGWRSRCRRARRATRPPRSRASWSPAGSSCIGCSRRRPRSNRGSCRSPADWETRHDRRDPPSARSHRDPPADATITADRRYPPRR